MVKDANKRINKIIDDFKNDFANYASATRASYMKTLAPGEKVPGTNRIYTAEGIAEFKDKAERYRLSANAVLDECLEDIRTAKTESPDSSAVNVLSLMSARNNVTIDELHDVLERYGSNYQVYRLCQDIAKRNDLGILGDHPIQNRDRDIHDLRMNLDRLFNYEDACNRADGSFYDFIQANIDQILDDGE